MSDKKKRERALKTTTLSEDKKKRGKALTPAILSEGIWVEPKGRRRPSLAPPLEDPGKKPPKKRSSSSVQPGGYKSPRLKKPEKKRPTISDEIKKFVKDEIMKGKTPEKRTWPTRPKVAPPLFGGGRVETNARGSGSARPQKFRKNG